MQFIDLFPVTVRMHNLGEPSETERAAIEDIGRARVPNDGNETSAARRVLNDPRLCGMKASILQQLKTYVDEIIRPATNPEIVITQSWLNFSQKGQWHHKHAHPGSWLSAVYYVCANKDLDKIYFHKNNYDRIYFPPENFNPYNSESWWLPVASGDLVIFPSYLMHHVAPVETDSIRVSLSLNTWFDGTTAHESNPVYLANYVVESAALMSSGS